MPITKFLQETATLEIQKYKKGKDIKDLRKTHVAYSGSPRKHPYDADKFILFNDPYCSSSYYEFENADIEFAEELPTIVNLDGETVTMILVWVKKQSIALRCIPFLVEETTRK